MIFLEVNSQVLFIIAITVAMLLVIAFFSVYLFFLFQKRKIRLKENYEQEILRTQIEIRDQAMSDVGRELHDHISQVMTLVKLNINLLSGQGLDAANEQRLAETKTLVKETIDDIRLLSKTLDGGLVEQRGLIESIRHELDRINRLGLFNCQMEITGEQFDIPSNTAFVVFRIVQENLQNILKHARCKNVLTHLTFTPTTLTLIQQEDGVGFDTTQLNNSNSNGSGLLNMQRRAAMINATLAIESQATKGSVLTLVVNK